MGGMNFLLAGVALAGVLYLSKADSMVAIGKYTCMDPVIRKAIVRCSQQCLDNPPCSHAYFIFADLSCSYYVPAVRYNEEGVALYAHYFRVPLSAEACPKSVKYYKVTDTLLIDNKISIKVGDNSAVPGTSTRGSGPTTEEITQAPAEETEAEEEEQSTESTAEDFDASTEEGTDQATTEAPTEVPDEQTEVPTEQPYQGPLFSELWGYRNNIDQKWCYATTTDNVIDKTSCQYNDTPMFLGVIINNNPTALVEVGLLRLLFRHYPSPRSSPPPLLSLFLTLLFFLLSSPFPCSLPSPHHTDHAGVTPLQAEHVRLQATELRHRQLLDAAWRGAERPAGYVPMSAGVCGPTLSAIEYRHRLAKTTFPDSSFFGPYQPNLFMSFSKQIAFYTWKASPF